MKKHLLLVGCLLLLVIAWFLFDHYGKTGTHDTRSKLAPSKVAKRSDVASVPLTSDKYPSQQTDENDALEAVQDAKREREFKEMETEEERRHNTPIVFYGLVLDQFHQPVSTAHVTYASVGGSFEGEREIFADSQGKFTIDGIRGKRLRVIVSHPGYYDFDQTHSYFVYAGNNRGPDFQPDPANPVIFRLRKKGEAAELVHQHDRVRFDGNEPERSFSFYDHSRRRDQPDYVILRRVETAERDSTGQPVRRLEMDVPGGGIQQRTDPFAYIAPTDGYQNSMYFMRPPYGGQLDYFVRFSSGNYGRFTIMGSAGDYLIDSYFNPDKSPNLEYDPAKEITVVRNGRMGVDLVYPAKDDAPKKP